MSVSWISVYQDILDEAKVTAHAEPSGERTRTVVIEFPSLEAARAAHASQPYQEALAALDGGAVRDVRIVPGGAAKPAAPQAAPASRA